MNWEKYVVQEETPSTTDWEQYTEAPTTQAKPSIPQRLWTGAGKNIKQVAQAPSIIRTLGGLLEGGIETGVRAIQPAGPEYPASPKGQAFQQGIVEPIGREVSALSESPLEYASRIPGRAANWAIDNPINALMNFVPFLPQKAQSWVNPITLASKPVGAIAGKFFSNPEAQRLYTSSVNIVSKKRSLEDIHRTAQRGLDLGILPREADLAKLKVSLDKVGGQIDDVITQGAKRGETIDTWKVVDYVDSVKEKFQNKIIHDPDLDKMLDDFKQGVLLEYGEKIPVDKAQKIKRTTQEFHNNQFDRLQAITAEAEKSLEHGVRMELEKKYPILSTLNPTQQENVWLKQAITDSIKQQMRSKMLPGISFFNVIKNKTLDNPMFKAHVAKIMDRLVKKQKAISPAMPTATAIPFIAGEVSDPYVEMAKELLNQ